MLVSPSFYGPESGGFLRSRHASAPANGAREAIMNTKHMAAVAAAISTIFVTAAANAQEKDQAQSGSKQSVAPVKNAVELTIGTGYTQGFGKVGSGQSSLTDLGTAGGSIQGGVAYRISPEIALGVYGSWGMF